MNHHLAAFVLVSLTTGCTTEPTDTGSDAEQPLTSSTDKRMLDCQLEYESFAPYATQPIDGFDDTVGKIVSGGVTATNGTYQLGISINPKPATNLSFNVQLATVATGEVEAYAVLPAPHVGGAYLFELGAHIPPVTLPITGGGTQAFDYLRAFCSIRNPS